MRPVQDLSGSLRSAIQTGEVVLGRRETEKAVRAKRAKLIIMAQNGPDGFLRDQKEVPVREFRGSNAELGAACAKPFSISVLAIVNPGKSKILRA